MKILLILLPFFLLIAFTSGKAQSLSQILKRHEEAVGRKALNKAETVIIKSEITSGKIKINVESTYKRPYKVRSESSLGNEKFINACDGKTAWESDPSKNLGRPHLLNKVETERIKSQSVFEGSLYRYKEKGSTIALLGKEKLNGKPVFKLKLVKKNGETEIIYIDAATYLFARTITEPVKGSNKNERIADISEYRSVKGIKFPFRFEVHSGENKIMQIVNSVEVDKKVPDSYFEFKNPAK